jgi:hypothetical protein
MKPGIQTTEFWLTLFAMVCINLPAIFVEDPPQWALAAQMIGNVLAAMGYSIARGMAKSGDQYDISGNVVDTETFPE